MSAVWFGVAVSVPRGCLEKLAVELPPFAFVRYVLPPSLHLLVILVLRLTCFLLSSRVSLYSSWRFGAGSVRPQSCV